MDSRQFQAMQATIQQWLVQLTGKQVNELREAFEIINRGLEITDAAVTG